MMEWSAYLHNMLADASFLDELQLTIVGESEPTRIPPIIKASILMTDRILSVQGKNIVIVFPERAQTSFIFAVMRTVYSIAGGVIKKAYDPKTFVKGEKLKLNNCVVSFNRIDESKGVTYLYIDTADCMIAAPIEIVPLLQRSNTNRPLSKVREYDLAKKEVFEKGLLMSSTDRLLALLSDYRTHISGSVFYVTSVMSTLEQMKSCLINENQLNNLLLLGHVNPDGIIRNIGAGQLAGNPAIIITADLYSVLNAKNNGAAVQSVIIDISNPNMIVTQLNAIDELMQLNIPLIFATDAVNSFDLQPLLDRSFNLWRWDEDSITKDLYGASSHSSNKKTENCANRKIEYLIMDCIEVGDTLKRLYNHRNEVQEQSPVMNDLFGRLFGLAFYALRNLVPQTTASHEQLASVLDECEYRLAGEHAFISPDAYTDYVHIIRSLKTIYSPSFSFGKAEALEKFLINNSYRKVCLVVPDHTDKKTCQEYWQDICHLYALITNVSVLYPSEYFLVTKCEYSITIISGWLSGHIMWRILHSYNTDKYIVLLYDFERRWKNAHTNTWSRILSNESSKDIIRKFLSTNGEISVSRFRESILPEVPDNHDELEDIELVLRENKYRKYIAHAGKGSDETVEAIPINFVGGYLAFFKTAHAIVSATDIIVNNGDQITMVFPSDLRVGDFVVVREADRDIIRDIADAILTNSGKHSCRELSGKWREALKVESLFSSLEDIYLVMKAAGFSKGFHSVRRWMADEDIIAPQSKEDIVHIAIATEDPVLLEIADQVYEAAITVRSAHVQAGRHLSNLLKKNIVSELRSFGDIDPFNIWGPISLSLDSIGPIRILKVIDKGDAVQVEPGNTNRLIDEM